MDKALREKIMLIRDPSIRSHYGQAIKDMRWQLFRAARRAEYPRRAEPAASGSRLPASAMPATKSSLLVAAGDEAQMQLRVGVILASLLITTPEVAEEFDTAVENLDCAPTRTTPACAT